MSCSIFSRIAKRELIQAVSRTKGSYSSLSKKPNVREFCDYSHRALLKSVREFKTKTCITPLKFEPKLNPSACSFILSQPYCTSRSNPDSTPEHGPPSYTYIDTKDNDTLNVMEKDMVVIEDFITEEEEADILKEIEPYLKRLKYESSHWDDAIHGYRETERRKWTEKNTAIIQRVRDTAFPPGVPQLSLVHVLDLKKEGYIKPHVDAVRFCGNTIAGISLLSTAVMRLVHTEEKEKFADILLKRRSLYIMKNDARYHYTHEVLPETQSFFCGSVVPRDRRISIMCRNEPSSGQH